VCDCFLKVTWNLAWLIIPNPQDHLRHARFHKVGGLIRMENTKNHQVIEIKLIKGKKTRLRGIGNLITKAA
jgi:hypothetical protein